MNGSRQHAPHSADLNLHQAAVGTGDNCNTKTRVNAHAVTHGSNAHEQMPTPGLCSCSSCSALPAVPISDDIFSLPLSALNLSTRLFLLFRSAGVFTIGQILEMDLESLLQLKLDRESIQSVVRRMRALSVFEPLHQIQAEESLQAEPEAEHANPGITISSQGNTPISHYDAADPILLAGHRYGWTVSIDDSVWSKREQWYLDIAPGTFPYPAGTLVEHNAHLYVIKCAGTSMLRVATLQDDEQGDEVGAAENLPVEESDHSEAEHERLARTRAARLCYEVSVSSLPPKYRDRISRRQRTCWVETPEPSAIRPSYFLTRIGCTPDALRGKHPIFVTEEEAEALAPVAQTPVPIIKVAPAYVLPEDVRRAICPGIARPMEIGASRDSASFPKHQDAQKGEGLRQQPTTTPCVKLSIPRHITQMPIKQLDLSLPLASRLHLAKITRVGQLLEMQEDAFRSLSIGDKGLREIARHLQAVQALPSLEPLVYDECYLHITDLWHIDEQQDTWRMVYVSVFPDRLSGWRSGPVYTVWLLQQHVDLAMDWDRSLESLDTHTLRVLVNEHAREQGAVAPPLAEPQPTRADEELELSASQNIFIPCKATDEALDALPQGHEERRYQERRADQLFGLTQEEWMALGHQATVREREQFLRAGQREEAFALEQVAACIEQVEDWYARLNHKPRILGLCGVFVEDQVPHERMYIVREKGKQARKKTIHWKEPVPRLVGYHLVVGAPAWVIWPENWVQKPCEERQIA